MIPAAWMCLLLASAVTELVDDVYRVPADEWRYVEVSLRQRPALLAADVEARPEGGDIRVSLVRGENLHRDETRRPHGALAIAEPGRAGRLRYYVRAPGDYAVVVENRDPDREASVRIRVWLDFGAGRGMQVTQLSPRRRIAVVLASWAAFLGIATWSARRLIAGMKRSGADPRA